MVASTAPSLGQLPRIGRIEGWSRERTRRGSPERQSLTSLQAPPPRVADRTQLMLPFRASGGRRDHEGLAASGEPGAWLRVRSAANSYLGVDAYDTNVRSRPRCGPVQRHNR